MNWYEDPTNFPAIVNTEMGLAVADKYDPHHNRCVDLTDGGIGDVEFITFITPVDKLLISHPPQPTKDGKLPALYLRKNSLNKYTIITSSDSEYYFDAFDDTFDPSQLTPILSLSNIYPELFI